MSEHSPEPSTSPIMSSIQSKSSPPPTPPSPDATESDFKLSRKREREGSIEPVPTLKTISDIDPGRDEQRETRKPAKKNRRRLDVTEEEDDGGSLSRSPSPSPPLLPASPRQEMKIKVRQISQGVEDLSWKNNLAEGVVTPDKDAEVGLAPIDNGEDESSGIISEEEAFPVPMEMKVDGDDVPPDSAPNSQASESAIDSLQMQPQAEDNLACIPGGDPDSDCGDKDKGLKRKHSDRGTSVGPQDSNDISQKGLGIEPLKRLKDNSIGATNPQDTKRPSPPREVESDPLKSKGIEILKRPRDNPEEDANPRETKRPSPPPEAAIELKKGTPSSAPKLSGFMAYASSNSPFAAVKGQNIFSSGPPKTTPSPPPFSSSAPSTSSFSPFSTGPAEFSSLTLKSPSPPTASKRTGFEAFASSSSPFAAVARSKSPILGPGSGLKLNRNKSPPRRANSANINAFSSYAGMGAQSFAIPMSKRARPGSPSGGSSSRSSMERNTNVGLFGGSGGSNGFGDSGSGEDEGDDRSTSFGERLRAGKDEEDVSDDEQTKITLKEQEFMTGEEDEETVHQVRGKLFSLSSLNQWKERGTGTLKLNVRRSDGRGARLVMRKEAVYTVLLNVTLFHGMRCSLAQDPRYLRFSVIEAGVTTHYNLRVASAKIAQELLDEINANIPSA